VLAPSDIFASRWKFNRRRGRAVPGPSKRPADTLVRTGAGLQLESLRRRNAASVAEVILSQKQVSRAEIASLVGLSQGAVTKITADLRRAGLIVEVEGASADRDPGRPRVPVSVDRSTYRFAGVHLGLRRSTVGLTDLAGDLVVELVVEHRSLEPEAVLREAEDLLRSAADADGGTVLGAGVCTGGWVDPGLGVVRENLVLGWHDVQLGKARDWLNVPVVVDSSARAFALAHARLTVGNGSHDLLYLIVGNIVGAAQLVDGRVIGGRDSAATTIDHLPVGPSTGLRCSCGRRDCLWSLASDVAVVERARSAGVIDSKAQLEDVITLATVSSTEGRRAARILRDRARYAGTAVGLLLDLFAPDTVILDGGILQAPQYLDTLYAAAAARSSRYADPSAHIATSGLGTGGLVRGAAALALDRFYRDPLAAFATA
jgi:predicted NBD/HSP70 family sugar kinase